MGRGQRGRARPRAAVSCLAAWVVLGGAPAASAADFLPSVSLHLEAARYAPVETDLHWTGTMGGGADLLGLGGLRLYIAGDVETIIGNTRRAFDATQASYHLETGGRFRLGRVIVNPVFHHVSRHMIDRNKEPAVDWNILGVRGETTLGEHARAHVGVGIGHTTLASLVGYRWEVTGHADLDLLRREHMTGYGSVRGRMVTVDPEPELPRGDFLDWAVEGGLRFARGSRLLDTFAAFEHRNDVFLLTPGARDRALFGIRIVLAEGN
jgi:hypothetical protein